MALTQITTNGIKDGEILNADINASAAIAGFKISPSFTANTTITAASPVLRLADSTDPQGTNGIIGKLEFFGNDGSSGGADVRSFIQTISTNAAGNAHALTIGLGESNNAPTEKVRILGDGKVGIGTTSPQTSLHITDAEANIRLSSDANGLSQIQFGDANDTIRGNIVYRNGTAGDALCFNGYNNTERMRITSDGKIGVGTTNPQVQIDGGGASSNGLNGLSNSTFYTGYTNSGGFGGIVAGSGANGNSPFIAASKDGNGNALNLFFQTNGTIRQTIDAAGNVGIGTTSPQRTLHQHVSHSSANYHQFTNSTTGNGSGDGGIVGIDANEDLIVWNQEGQNVRFGTSNTERMRVQTNGGISFNGDTAADNALDDYEEGTWTATLGPASSEFTPTSNTNTCTYTKVGRQVTVVGIAKMTTPSNLNSYVNDNINHALKVSGLPFTVANAINGRSSATMGVGGDIQFPNGVLASHGSENSTNFAVFVNKSNGGTRTAPTINTSTQMNFHFSYTYFI